MESPRITLASLRRGTSRKRPELEALHNRTAGKALLLTFAWSVLGGVTSAWPWWRVLLTFLLASVVSVIIVVGGSGIIDDQRWPNSASAKLRSSSSFLVWSALLLLGAWWMGTSSLFLSATAACVLLWTVWVWPAADAPKDEKRTKHLALPPDVNERVRRLPLTLPSEIEASIDAALADWQHLNEVLASDSELHGQVEPLELHEVAHASLSRLLEAARTAAELARIASERSDDEHAPLAARTAFQRMQAIERGLHDTTSTLLRYVASRDDNEESALRVRVEELEALAEVEEALTTPQHVAQV